MNCNKPGEMAVVYWPDCAVHNHIVTTKELIPQGTWFYFAGKPYHNSAGPAWWVECPSPIFTKLGKVTRFPVYDKDLRPIFPPERGGVEQRTFQRPVPALAETITAALNTQKYGGQQ